MTSSCCLLLALLGCWQTANAILFANSQQQSPLVYQLSNRQFDPKCPSQMTYVIDSSMRLSTAALPDLRMPKICDSPLCPFGTTINDPRGMSYWYLRLRISALAKGQKLHVVNTGAEKRYSMDVGDDQRIDLTHNSHAYPLTLDMRYRYVRLYWNSTHDAARDNVVNITIAVYARFNDTVNVTMQQLLCERYGNRWCAKGESNGVCVSPTSCSLQDDCFDEFTEPDKCTDIVLLGNATYPVQKRSWVGRNLQWLALGAILLVLVFALAKICSQKRNLDIDDDYEYKASGSEDEEEVAAVAAAAVRRQSPRDYAYPSDIKEQDEDEDEEGDEADDEVASEVSQLKGTAESRGAGDGKEEDEEKLTVVVDSEESQQQPPPPPPPPPPRLSEQQQKRRLNAEAEEEDFVNVSSLQQEQQHESWCSGEYARIFAQPSPSTVVESLPSDEAKEAGEDNDEEAGVSETYTELVVPLPTRQQEKEPQEQQEQPLELRPVPSGRLQNPSWADSYDRNYIVI